jgi:hypothetical protein
MEKPSGSFTDKALSILEGAATLVLTANRLAAKLSKQRRTVTLPRHEAELVVKQLREAATMIDNFMLIIEQRELVKLDKIGNPAREKAASSRRCRRSSRRKAR